MILDMPGQQVPPELVNTWPMIEADDRFILGLVHDDRADTPSRAMDARDVGMFECDLVTGTLHWSPQVHDLFGLPCDVAPVRAESVRQYAEPSRAIMERLRAHAIRHRRGFTMDAEIRPLTGGTRWMRLIAAPVCVDGRAVRLHGLKRDVSTLYRT